MSNADLAESHAAAEFFALGVAIGLALAFLLAVGCTKFLDWYFKLGLHKDVSHHVFALVFS